MCFIDLHKAYHSVHRELLWEVLVPSCISTELVTIIHCLHGGVQTRVHTDDGVHSKCFFVTPVLRNGCVMSLFLSNVFFAAALYAELTQFMKDETLVKEWG